MTTREPPYPADTRAKGWRFELDYEQIEQSDTWDIAAEIPMCQHALLMMWLVAWRQEPCGSLPSDEAVIRAKCKIPPKAWAQCRDVLMRGWWAASDGRLYHGTLTARVLEMMEYRRKEAERRNRNRGKPTVDPELSRGTTGGEQGESSVTPDTGTGTGTNTEEQVPRVARKRAAPVPRPGDVSEQVWDDWVALRVKKRTTVSETAIGEARSEAAKAGMTLEAFLRVWCARGSQGLQADWIKPAERGGVVTPIGKQRAIEEHNRAVGEQWLREQEAMDASN